MGTALFTDGTDSTPIDAVTCGPIHSSSKSYLEVRAEGSTLREAALALGVMGAEDFDRLTDPARMVG